MMMNIRKNIKQWLYGKCPGFAGSFPYYGTKVYFPKNSIIFRLACEQGIYEQENLNILSSLVKPNSTYFDVGANIGLMSIPILQQHNSCMVVSFEPSPNTYKFLNRTSESSQFNKRWKVISKAVGSQAGTLDFFIASPDMGAFDGFKDTKRANTNNQIEVPVTTIDIEWETLGKPKLSVIKIDVEGAELETLKGALNCIQNDQPSILLEWNATNLQAYNCPVESLIMFAEKYNYQVYSLPNLIPVFNVESLLLHMINTESFLLFSSKKAT
ncbi:FkbM family methyltransferase [Nostoc sp.]|uniref:FkbM family methyltransferase n=1 Tax=Nostoc sp. TaxID=1180 RepID=UPI002FF98D8E